MPKVKLYDFRRESYDAGAIEEALNALCGRYRVLSMSAWQDGNSTKVLVVYEE
ncbi:MAG: hypothetical protein AB1665_08100 [Candidatus Thermoplasmatota archaeon]